MAAWHDAQRMQLEIYHGPSSLFEDPPVLIRAIDSAGERLTVVPTSPRDSSPAVHHNNGPGRKPERASATGASQETS